CNKSFNRPSNLRIHVNTHTGATPFRCPFPGCGRKFNVNSNMRRHYRNHIYLRAVWVVQWPANAESNFTGFSRVPSFLECLHFGSVSHVWDSGCE
ncbi:hypothetical protein ARMSODRAFT_899505, partial [Armillaria solidipes]